MFLRGDLTGSVVVAQGQLRLADRLLCPTARYGCRIAPR